MKVVTFSLLILSLGTSPVATAPAMTPEVAALTVYNAYKTAKEACRSKGLRLQALALVFDAKENPTNLTVSCGGKQERDT